ncbi:MAG: hypothetical protein Q9164_006153 [Protoblastenia rupestris]
MAALQTRLAGLQTRFRMNTATAQLSTGDISTLPSIESLPTEIKRMITECFDSLEDIGSVRILSTNWTKITDTAWKSALKIMGEFKDSCPYAVIIISGRRMGRWAVESAEYTSAFEVAFGSIYVHDQLAEVQREFVSITRPYIRHFVLVHAPKFTENTNRIHAEGPDIADVFIAFAVVW